MQTWDDILATAVVGTEQREPRVVAREDELGSLLAQMSNTDREGLLLSAASIVGLYRSAGVAPPADTQPLLEACDEDDASRVNRTSGQHLALMLEGEFTEVLPEWLAAVSSAHKRVPEELLPALFERGREELSLRESIVAVMGRRGAWLASQNPDWVYATPREEKDVWETGTREERLLLLNQLRSVDPAKARELLATTWSQESAQDRAAFLDKLSTGLNSGDEPFLNEALNDRSRDVRRVARILLAVLPDSELSRRYKELANEILSFKKPLIGKARIEVALPDDPIAWLNAKDFEIDNLPRGVSSKALGPKGWALKEIVSLTPISHWSELWQKSPGEIIRAGFESEWRSSFAFGFAIAAGRFRDRDWIEALILFAPNDPEQPRSIELPSHLPAARLEALIMNSLKSEATGLSDGPSYQLLMFHRRPWSDQLSRTVVKSIKKRINQGKDQTPDWQTKAALKLYAQRISPAMYDELASGWPTESEAWANWSRHVDAFQSLLAFRRDMHRAITEKE